MSSAALAAQVEALKPPKNFILRIVGWGLFLSFLVWSWQGAEIDPYLLWTDRGNMVQFAADFFSTEFFELEVISL